MDVSRKILGDGSVELVLQLSAEEAAALQAREPSDDDIANSRYFFRRKTAYCVTCEGQGGRRFTMEAYGDIHAFFMAANECGGAYNMSSGRCQ